LNSWGI